ncbi:serine hydrolase domain-containing protein [Microbacterium sp. R86528]|uniref:serine hydrolase domain-containing protein n=1 Tax=Microbacterium sp. R86528 TaxID=3093864 RepID=UPI0037C6481E
MPTSFSSSRRQRALALSVIALTGVSLGACTSAGGGEAEETSAAEAVLRPAAPEGQLPELLQSELQATLDEKMAEYDVPGAVAGVWIPGEGSWMTAAGLADVEGGVDATTDMVWPIRSITKSYTVTLLLQLADEGTLSLDDTLDQYVDGVPNGDEITLLELANMSSGNADYVNEGFIEEFVADPTRVFTLDELNAAAIGQPARFAPGSEYLYTNSNINFLGSVIEEATGQRFTEVLTERILEPLEQTGTSYITDVDDWSEPHAVGYIVEDGVPIAQQENASIFGPAGSMFSTLDDGRVWAEMLGTGALVTPEMQEIREVGHEIPSPPYDLYAVGIGTTDGWWGHNGEGIGFTAATFYEPETGASIVVYMNESNVADGAHPADQTFRAMAAAIEASM